MHAATAVTVLAPLVTVAVSSIRKERGDQYAGAVNNRTCADVAAC
jgi:hypothetical protein